MLEVMFDIIREVVLSSSSDSRHSFDIWGVVSLMTKQQEERMKNITKMKNWV